jgi:hypothetical protein
MNKAPLNDEILIAISRMVDDSQVDTREPSHSQIEDQFRRVGILDADPNQHNNKPVGKAKRVREVLSWAIENDNEAGEKLVYCLLSLVKGLGGFREKSSNYVGKEAITNLIESFKSEGYIFSSDGVLNKVILEDLNEIEAIDTLKAYARRAKRGVEDAALLTGTSKDLMEAVAKHIIYVKRGVYPTQSNFPALMGHAFAELGLATSSTKIQPNEPAQYRVERALLELACSINSLRNKQGTGHGRPNPTTIKVEEGRLSIESIGIISEFLLSKL